MKYEMLRRIGLSAAACLVAWLSACADDPPSEAPSPAETQPAPAETQPPAVVTEPPVPAEGAPAAAGGGRKFPLTPVAPGEGVWIDTKRKIVALSGEVCLREGPLELFACPKGSKEHESVVAIFAQSQTVHAALLAVGAKPGHPVRFRPEYQPAEGTRVDVLAVWTDAEGKQRQTPAQNWIRNVRTEKPLAFSWVFAGSNFYVDEDTGERYYLANDGDLICVSNFTTATLDLPIKSTDTNEGLLFEAFTENIPPHGTKVTVVLIPRPADEAGPKAPAEEE